MNSEDFFESIELQFKNELPFVAYRKPKDRAIKAILQFNNKLFKVRNFTEKGFVFAPFDDNEDIVLFPSDKSEILTTNNVSLNVPITIGSEASYNFFSKLSSEEKQYHINLVQKGIDAIETNQFQKVVLSRKETVSLIDANPISIFKRLLNTYTSTFVYVWYHPKTGMWLGATPETLLKVEGNRFLTMALAGTQKYNDKVDIHWDDKNRVEQQFVIDFIVDRVNTVVNNIKVSEVETIKAGSLLHLKADISGLIKQDSNNLQLLIKKLHPTPAVCGLPTNITKQFILDNENYNREFYTGFLGELNIKVKGERFLNSKNIENKAYTTVKTVSNLYVNLRCMQLKNYEASIYVGGGITKDSIPESEWEETLNKTEIIKRVL